MSVATNELHPASREFSSLPSRMRSGLAHISPVRSKSKILMVIGPMECPAETVNNQRSAVVNWPLNARLNGSFLFWIDIRLGVTPITTTTLYSDWTGPFYNRKCHESYIILDLALFVCSQRNKTRLWTRLWMIVVVVVELIVSILNSQAYRIFLKT